MSSDKKVLRDGKVYHESAGGALIVQKDSQLRVALIKNSGGHWVLPKGHIKEGESAEKAAEREICEELGLSMKISLIGALWSDQYSFKLDTDTYEHLKVVHHFLFVCNDLYQLTPQVAEGIIEARWFDIYEAIDIVHYPSDRETLRTARQNYLDHVGLSHAIKRGAVSICIPTHNGGGSIANTIKSVIESATEAKVDWEILVGIDHCTDSIKTVCRDLQIKVSQKIIVIDNDGLPGKSTCLNLLAAQAKNDLLLFSDDDVLFTKNTIKDLLDAATTPEVKSDIFYPSSVPMNKHYRNPWKALIWKVCSIKFRTNIYNAADPYLIGRVMLMHKASWSSLPCDKLLADDVFLMYQFYPRIKLVSSPVYFNSVDSVTDYLHRFCRISEGRAIAAHYFPKGIQSKMQKIRRIPSNEKIRALSFGARLEVRGYYSIRKLAELYYSFIYRKHAKDWERISQ